MSLRSQGAALQHTRRPGTGPQDRLGPSPPRRGSPAHERVQTDAAVGGSAIGREAKRVKPLQALAFGVASMLGRRRPSTPRSRRLAAPGSIVPAANAKGVHPRA